MTCQGKAKAKARAKQVKGPRLRPPVCCKLGGIAGDVATQGFRVDGVAPGRDGVNVNAPDCIHIASALAWELRRYCRIPLQVYSDEKARSRRRVDVARLARDDEDNFQDYLPKAIENDVARHLAASTQAYPRVRSLGDVITINPKLALQDAELHPKAELLQLADVILGAVAQAIHPRSSLPTKRDLGHMVAEWILDIRKEPWKQRLNLHRRFSVAYFPDGDGRPYTDGPLPILGLGPSQQLTLGL
jgi:hypothetical protein